jgi:hypothetical protein
MEENGCHTEAAAQVIILSLQQPREQEQVPLLMYV